MVTTHFVPPGNSIMNQRIPKKKRYGELDDDANNATQPQAKQQRIGGESESTLGPQDMIPRLKQKHHECNNKPYGSAHLFFATSGDEYMKTLELKKRCISSDDCPIGRYWATFMDTTAFRGALKKDYCPMVAYSVDKKKWCRGYILHLGVRTTFILKVNHDGYAPNETNSEVITLKPMGKHTDLKIRYITAVTPAMNSKEDGFLVSSVDGPDMILVSTLPQVARDYYYRGRQMEPIINIPKANVVSKCVPTPLRNQSKTFPTIPVRNVATVLPENKNADVEKVVEKVNDKAFEKHIAFPHVNVTDDGRRKMSFVPFSEAKDVLRNESLSIDEYEATLNEKESYHIHCNEFKVGSRGLVIEECQDESLEGNTKKLTRNQLPHQRRRQLVVSRYTCQDQLQIDNDAYLYLIDHVTRNHTRQRSSTKCVGKNVNIAINDSNQPNVDPRKDKAAILKSELWENNMDETFAPLLFATVRMLGCFSVAMSRAFDIVFDASMFDVFRSLLPETTYDPSLSSNALTILTYPALRGELKGVNFANTGHCDCNDKFEELINLEMRHNIEAKLEELMKTGTPTVPKEKECWKDNVYALFHLLRLGSRDGNLDNKLQYSTNTTCGYQIESSSDREVIATFLFPKRAALVRFDPNQLIFQNWDASSEYHQTPVAITYDRTKKIVHLRDKCLSVIAWGAGKSKRTFLSNNGIRIPRGNMNAATFGRALRGASDEIIRAAARTFTNTRIAGRSILEHFNVT